MQTYNEALEILGSRTKRKLENNTYLEMIDDSAIAVRLHGTYVVTYYKSGAIKLRSGGWYTPTTKDRINKYAPVNVTQRKYEWFVDGKPFEEGMFISAGDMLGYDEKMIFQ